MRNRLKFSQPRYDADTGEGGTMKILNQIKETVDGNKTEAEATSKKVAELATELETVKADNEKDMAKMAKEAVELRRNLAKSLGNSGADDFLNDMQKFLATGLRAHRGRKVADDVTICGEKAMDVVAKAAADFTTTTDATAGYLVPEVMMPEIRKLLDIYGNFYPLVTKATVQAGQSILMNKDLTRPVASWRATQVTTIVEEATPMSFAQNSIVTQLLGSYIQIANELMGISGTNFGAVATVRMLHAILRKLEFGMIAGTTGAGEPSDGIIADATDQGTMATMTLDNLITFLQDCIADNEYAFDTTRNVLMMSPAKALALASQSVGASELTGMLVWGDPRNGVPSRLMGYDLITHPACNNGSSDHVLLLDPSTITLGEDAATSVDFSMEAGSAFVENSTILRVFNHYDWDLGQTVEMHKKVITA